MRREFKRPSVSAEMDGRRFENRRPSWPDISYTVSLNGNVSLKEVFGRDGYAQKWERNDGEAAHEKRG
jgi:hypothetical protein